MLKVSEPGLLQADLSDRVNIFLGAGFSTLAKNARKNKLPTGNGLKEALIDEFKRTELSDLDLQSVYTILSSDAKSDVDQFLVNIFNVESGYEQYDALRNLAISHVYTTNIDNLARKIFRPIEGFASPVFHDVHEFGEPRDIGSTIQYIPLHGCVDHEEPNFVFTAGQISSAFQSDQQTWFVFQRELQRRPTLFLGYGMNDAGVLQALHNSTLGNANRWVLLYEATDAARKLYDSLGFNIIEGSIEDFLSYVDTLPSVTKAFEARTILGRIPSRDQVAQRPVRVFFLGAEPEWSDAYSPQVVKRRPLRAILDKALQGKNVSIVGLPLSGKSTILRQVATELNTKRRCIYFDRLSVAIAQEIIAEYSDSSNKPVVFIDQFIDSRDGFNVLADAGGFKFVVAESSIFYDSINPRSLRAPLETVSCTSVSSPDMQSILNSLPADIRRKNQSATSSNMVEEAEYLGLFEGLVRHVFDQDLRLRFRNKLAEFEQRDPRAFDVYLMACYSNMCRTLVSYDMIHMFLNTKDYAEGYDIVQRINEFVGESDNPNDTTQDHFSVRSSGLARIAIRESRQEAFGRMYDRFHKSVGPRVIPDYRTFRRYAYDNDFAVKAFPDPKDGRAFYEKLFLIAENAYDYQHGAVYMSKKGRYSQAFEWIDKAMTITGNRNFAIRNSHAVILFEANIGVFETNVSDNIALDGIRESMRVLQSCIENDQWRGYHLLRFSDQAMKVAKNLRTPESLAWLGVAQAKLSDAFNSASKLGSRDSYNVAKYRRLLREVESSLIEF